MGMYLNVGNDGFRSVRKGLYVDKTGLISFVNAALGTKEKLICVSRPRRFGKSYAAQMLCAYYDKNCDSDSLFRDLKIAQDPSYQEHRNRYDVIYLDVTWFISTAPRLEEVVGYLQEQVVRELAEAFPMVEESASLPMMLSRTAEATGHRFIILIDEWDALFREEKNETESQREYVQLLRGLFKSSQTDRMIEGAYMTGILPIKKYGTQSALTDFREYTMLQPQMLAEYIGFTEEEVEGLCGRYGLDFGEARKWYDGYSFRQAKSIYSPNSIVRAVKNGEFGDYWTETETYESLKYYIGMNEDGLRDAIISMLSGLRYRINTRTFQNDMWSMKSKDDVLTLLVHLGYLTYDSIDETVRIPNKEVSQEYVNAIRTMDWHEVIASVEASRKLLEALWAMDGKTVAEGIDRAHREISILQYNDENALSCTIHLAFYFAREYYTIIREFPSGKGFADICFLPRKLYAEKPAVVVELKWDKDVYGAIEQIKNRQYVEALKDYQGNILLAGISYEKKTKEHTCVIEKMQK